MTHKRLVELAYYGALEFWVDACKKSHEDPEDVHAKMMQDAYHKELQEIRKELKRLEHTE